MPRHVDEIRPSDQHEATEIRFSFDEIYCNCNKTMKAMFVDHQFEFIIYKYKLQIGFGLY